jgi:hypothetical protein
MPATLKATAGQISRQFRRTPGVFASTVKVINMQNSFSAFEITTGSEDYVFELLSQTLSARLPSRDDPNFLAELRKLPIGLRAMAATYELDVSLTLDDLGWHFGNWHDAELAEETAIGLQQLGATELAALFQDAFALALKYWRELGDDGWMDWYHGSALEEAVMPLNQEVWKLLEGKSSGIFSYWVAYAKRHPERIGAMLDA